MNVNGIIAEYNPFHNGHQYHMESARARNGADYTVIVMSGNFVQRGAPALLDKFDRARMALSCGADLVLELPTYYSTSSAEYFATGAVTLLDKLGVVTHLCFGSECGETEVLAQIARILLDEPEDFKQSLQNFMRQGYTYPIARTEALLRCAPALSAYKDILSKSNNILGIEYLKCMLRRDSSIIPDTTPRVGSDYRDKRMGINQSSALAIRQAIFSKQDADFLRKQMPESAYQVMSQAIREDRYLDNDDLSNILHHKLLAEREDGFTQYLDVSDALSDRICNNLYQFESYRGFCDLLKTKDMTYVRISRCLLHILLNIRKDRLKHYKTMDYIPYARVLGFRKSATPLMSAIKENSSIPLVTKLPDAEKTLYANAKSVLQEELCINELYYSTMSIKTRCPMNSECSMPLVILE